MYKRQAYTASFAEQPCQCVKNHSPKPLAVELHHRWPQADQIARFGHLVDPERVPLCDTAHKNVHTAIDKWLRGQPCDLPNKYQRKLAQFGYQRIADGRTPA